MEVLSKETGPILEEAQNDRTMRERKYYLPKSEIKPAVYVTLTDNWITFGIRYPAEARSRRAFRNRISRLILEGIEKEKNVRIASSTIEINRFPNADKEAR